MIRKLLCISLVLGASALATPKRAATLRLRAAVEVRGGALIPKEGFVKACAWVYGLYGIQFTLMTKKFIEDHFQGPADPLAIFMARGAGVSIMWMAWSLTKLPLETVFLRAAASRAIPRSIHARRVAGPSSSTTCSPASSTPGTRLISPSSRSSTRCTTCRRP